MDKKLRNYIKEAEKLAKHPSREIIEYHKTMTAQFQHERLIHLIVTMFFALFLMLFFAMFLFAVFTLSGEGAQLVLLCLGLVTAIFLIVTLFYVRHYYQLENGTQILEDITKEMYQK